MLVLKVKDAEQEIMTAKQDLSNVVPLPVTFKRKRTIFLRDYALQNRGKRAVRKRRWLVIQMVIKFV